MDQFVARGVCLSVYVQQVRNMFTNIRGRHPCRHYLKPNVTTQADVDHGGDRGGLANAALPRGSRLQRQPSAGADAGADVFVSGGLAHRERGCTTAVIPRGRVDSCQPHSRAHSYLSATKLMRIPKAIHGHTRAQAMQDLLPPPERHLIAGPITGAPRPLSYLALSYVSLVNFLFPISHFPRKAKMGK
jgi:hypothetical protein